MSDFKKRHICQRFFLFYILSKRAFLCLIVGLYFLLGCACSSLIDSTGSNIVTLKFSERPLGVSTHYIGAVEGDVNFNTADMVDLGINTYRIYGGMSRWEPEDDDGVYGLPSIIQIKENPGLVNWEQWDTVMTNPKAGTDYAFSGNPGELWQGSAQTIFESLKRANIRPVLTMRNVDPAWNPDWALQLNPPRTESDWNEWWEHVFATVYWLNVRNDYRINDFEIHNEPDYRQQGWGGNQNDYFELVRVAEDAISHVYSTYLPNRTFHIHAPKSVGGSSWPRDTFIEVADKFDSVNFHTYERDITEHVEQVRSWMCNTSHTHSPLWLGEWGSYTKGDYDDFTFALGLIENMIRMSLPGDTYVYGSHLFSLYDWGISGNAEGLIDANGNRRLGYYAFRMGIRALQGGRDVLLAEINHPGLMAIATKDEREQIYLLLVNKNSVRRTVRLNIPGQMKNWRTVVWEFSEAFSDAVVKKKHFMNEPMFFHIPANAARLVVID